MPLIHGSDVGTKKGLRKHKLGQSVSGIVLSVQPGTWGSRSPISPHCQAVVTLGVLTEWSVNLLVPCVETQSLPILCSSPTLAQVRRSCPSR